MSGCDWRKGRRPGAEWSDGRLVERRPIMGEAIRLVSVLDSMLVGYATGNEPAEILEQAEAAARRLLRLVEALKLGATEGATP